MRYAGWGLGYTSDCDMARDGYDGIGCCNTDPLVSHLISIAIQLSTPYIPSPPSWFSGNQRRTPPHFPPIAPSYIPSGTLHYTSPPHPSANRIFINPSKSSLPDLCPHYPLSRHRDSSRLQTLHPDGPADPASVCLHRLRPRLLKSCLWIPSRGAASRARRSRCRLDLHGPGAWF